MTRNDDVVQVDSHHSNTAALLQVLLISFLFKPNIYPQPPVVIVRLSPPTLLFNVFGYFRLLFFFFYLLRYYLSRLASCIFLQPSNRSPQTWLTKVKDGAHLSPLVQLDPQSAEVAVKSGQTGETYLEITFSPICACCCLWCTRYQFNQLPPGQSMHEC